MNTRFILGVATALVLAVAGGTYTAGAQEHDHSQMMHQVPGASQEAAAAQAPEVIDSIIMEIHKHHFEISKAVKSGAFEKIPSEAAALYALAEKLENKASPDKQAQVKAAVENLGKVVDAFKASSSAQDAAASQANLGKLDSAILELQKLFK